MWGDDSGYAYRTFNKLNFSYEFVQTARDFMSLVMFVLLLITYAIDGMFNLLFLTNWGLHFTFFSLVLNYQASIDQKQYPDKVTGLTFYKWRSAVIMYDIAICSEIVLSILFWLLLWKTPEEYTFYDIFNIITHSVPVAFTLIDFVLQKWIFRFNQVTVVFLIGLIYGLVNFTYVKLYNKPIYPILPWNDTASYILMGSALLLLVIVFLILYMITYLNYQKNKEDKMHRLLMIPIVMYHHKNNQLISIPTNPKLPLIE